MAISPVARVTFRASRGGSAADARKLFCLSSVLQELIATYRAAVIPSLTADAISL
jgi:hypothetical protein